MRGCSSNCRGKTPFALSRSKVRVHTCVIGAGFGGAARTATGYAFCGISRQIDGLLRQLAVTGPGPGLLCPAAYSWRTRALDRVFLQVLRAEPARMADIIGSMASGLRGDDFAAFLSDSDGWWPALRAIWQVPKRPFLRAVAEQATLGRRHG